MKKISGIAAVLASVFCAVCAGTFAALSFIPYKFLKLRLDSLACDGKVDYFSVAFFDRIMIKGRIVGAVFIVLSFVFFVFRRRVSVFLERVGTRFVASGRDFARDCASAVRKERREHIVALLILLVVAAVIRSAFLFQPMRTDEARTFLMYASKPLWIGLSCYDEPNNHLFSTFLVHVSYLVLGNKPWVIRLPALCAGLAMVPATYIVTRLMYASGAGLLAAALVASSSALIDYSTNARGYTTVCLAFLLLVILARYLVSRRNLAAWFLFIAVSVLALYTIPIAIFPVGTVVLWLFLTTFGGGARDDRAAMRKYIFFSMATIVIAVVLLYLPIFVTFGLNSVFANPYVRPRDWMFLAGNFPARIHATWALWHRDIPLALQVLLQAGFLFSLFCHRRISRDRVPFAIAVGVWCVLLAIMKRVAPEERVWLFLLPLYLGMASAGAVFLWSLLARRIRAVRRVFIGPVLAVALSVYLSVLVWLSQSPYQTFEATLRNAEEITVFLKPFLRKGDVIVCSIPRVPILSYYFLTHRVPPHYLYNDKMRGDRIIVITEEGADATACPLDSEELRNPDFSSPRLIRTYECASVYLMTRKNLGKGP